MLDPLFHILAASDDTDWTKIIAPILFFLLWALSAVASVIGKKQQEKKRREAQRRLEQQASAPQPPARPGRAQPPVLTPPHLPKRPPPIAKKPPAPAKMPKPTIKRVVQKLPEPEILEAAKARVPETGNAYFVSVSGSTPLSASKRQFIQAMLHPRSLRQQMILMEILQPPVSERPASR